MSKRFWAYLIGAALGLATQLHWLQGHGWDNTAYVRLTAGPAAGFALGWLYAVFLAPFGLFERLVRN